MFFLAFLVVSCVTLGYDMLGYCTCVFVFAVFSIVVGGRNHPPVGSYVFVIVSLGFLWVGTPLRPSSGFATLNVADERLVQAIAAEAIRKAERLLLVTGWKRVIPLTHGRSWVTMVISNVIDQAFVAD